MQTEELNLLRNYIRVIRNCPKVNYKKYEKACNENRDGCVCGGFLGYLDNFEKRVKPVNLLSKHSSQRVYTTFCISLKSQLLSEN